MIKLRRLFCFFGFHKYKINGANQYGEWGKCLYCEKKVYYSYLIVSKIIGEPVNPCLPQSISDLIKNLRLEKRNEY